MRSHNDIFMNKHLQLLRCLPLLLLRRLLGRLLLRRRRRFLPLALLGLYHLAKPALLLLLLLLLLWPLLQQQQHMRPQCKLPSIWQQQRRDNSLLQNKVLPCAATAAAAAAQAAQALQQGRQGGKSIDRLALHAMPVLQKPQLLLGGGRAAWRCRTAAAAARSCIGLAAIAAAVDCCISAAVTCGAASGTATPSAAIAALLQKGVKVSPGAWGDVGAPCCSQALGQKPLVV